MSTRIRELLLIGGLIAGAVGFGLALIPAGIEEGFGSQGPGLSPRAMPQVAVAGIALALVFGLVQTVLANDPSDEILATEGKRSSHLLRVIGAVLICLLFAYLGFDIVGFYFGGMVMAAALTLLLGERKVIYVVLLPILILALIYGLFELGFQIKLPKSGFIPGIPI